MTDTADQTRTTAWRDAAVLAFATLFPPLMAWLYFVALQGPGHAGGAAIAAYVVGKSVQFLLPVFWAALWHRERLGLRRPSAAGLALGVGFGLLVAAAMFALYFGLLRASPWLAQTPAQIWERLERFHLATLAGFLVLAVSYSVVHSFLEEYYWRWFVFAGLRRHLPLVVAVALSALGFTLHHVVVLGAYFPGRFWTMALPLSACVGAGGVVWALIYARGGSLLSPWLSHLLVDAAIMAIGYDLLADYW